MQKTDFFVNFLNKLFTMSKFTSIDEFDQFKKMNLLEIFRIDLSYYKKLINELYADIPDKKVIVDGEIKRLK